MAIIKKLIARSAVGLPNKDNFENLRPQLLSSVTLKHLIAIQQFQGTIAHYKETNK